MSSASAPVPAPAPGNAETKTSKATKGSKSSKSKAPKSSAPAKSPAAKSAAAKPPAARSTGTGDAEAARKSAYTAAGLLKNISDPTRLGVLLILADGEMNVGDLCGQLGQSQPACSHHLALMRHGGIIEPRRAGKHNFYGLTDKGRKLIGAIRAVMA